MQDSLCILPEVCKAMSKRSIIDEMSVKTDRSVCWVQVATISREDSRTLVNPFAIEHQRGLLLRHLDKARARAALRLAYVPSCPLANPSALLCL